MATLKTTIRTPSVVRTIVRGMGRPGESGAATPIAARSLLGNATNATALPVGISDPAVLQSIVQCPSESEFDSFVSFVGASFSAVDAALAARVLNTDGRLADSREWIASTISQAEAEAGTATTRRAFTAQRIRQAIVGWWTEEGFGERLGVVYDTPNDHVALECADSEWNFVDATTRDNLRIALNAVETFSTLVTGGLNNFQVTPPADVNGFANFFFNSHSGPSLDDFGIVRVVANPEDGIILLAQQNGVGSQQYAIQIAPTGFYVEGRDDFRRAIEAIGNSFDTVWRNLKSLSKSVNRDGSNRISSIVFTLPDASAITGTINRDGNNRISSIVLSGATPAGIQLTKTITRTGGVITGVSYS